MPLAPHKREARNQRQASFNRLPPRFAAPRILGKTTPEREGKHGSKEGKGTEGERRANPGPTPGNPFTPLRGRLACALRPLHPGPCQ